MTPLCLFTRRIATVLPFSGPSVDEKRPDPLTTERRARESIPFKTVSPRLRLESKA